MPLDCEVLPLAIEVCLPDYASHQAVEVLEWRSNLTLDIDPVIVWPECPDVDIAVQAAQQEVMEACLAGQIQPPPLPEPPPETDVPEPSGLAMALVVLAAIGKRKRSKGNSNADCC